MQGFTLAFCLVILIVKVTSNEFLKRLINHPSTFPCNILKCPENKLCISQFKNKNCSECTVSSQCTSLEILSELKCPVGFPVVNTISNSVVHYLHCNHDGDCPSRSYCFGNGRRGICCSGFKHYVFEANKQQLKHHIQNQENDSLQTKNNFKSIIDIILKKNYKLQNPKKKDSLASTFVDLTSKPIDNYHKTGQFSTFQQKSLVDYEVRTDTKTKQTVHFKHRNRRSPHGYFDSLHPADQGLEVPLDKPGQCSNVRLGKWSGGCMDTCFNDADCYSNLKCCFNGCARSCQFPIAVYNPDIPSKKPGRCPRLSSIGFTECAGSSCIVDTDCRADDICCNSGDCGRICQHPIANSPYW